MSVAVPNSRRDRIGRFARAALKQALGVVTGDRRLEAEGAAERALGTADGTPAGRGEAHVAARPERRRGRSRVEKRDVR